MGRLVRVPPPGPAGPAGAPGGPPPPAASDPYTERVAKYVPAEIVAGYFSLSEVIKQAGAGDPRQPWAATALFAVGLVLTPVYLIVVGKPRQPREYVPIGLSTVAFVLWAYALGGPFALGEPSATLGPYAGWLGALAVGLFTWVAGLFKP